MNQPVPERNAPLWILSLMLLVSGNCALMFQVVWIRELRLVFGATTASSAAVLAIFMAGLGLGNWLFGSRIDAAIRPLRCYGLLELGIALTAGISPFLLMLVRQMYVNMGGQAALGSELATLSRLAASAMILAVPTILMGGTMPAAARAVSNAADPHRRGVALIYGLNTIGAVLGAGIANFMLLEALGNRGVLWFACGINLLLAVSALLISKRLSSSSESETQTLTDLPQAVKHEQATLQQERLGIVCLASGTVGFVFFLMEIVWYRMLGPLLGGTTYTFGLILCVALLGIGIGGALYAILARLVKPTLSLLAFVCTLEAFLIAVPFWYGDQIAFWVLQQQSQPVATFLAQVWNWFQVGAFVIFPAALVAGFQFPLLIAIAGTGKEHVGKHVGWTFAANTLGAISGSIAGGFFLLPVLTAPGLWKLSICLLLILGLTLLLAGQRWKSVSLAPSVVLSLASIFMILETTGPTAVWRHAGIGARRASLDEKGENGERNFSNTKNRQCIWEAEGRESSVAITATDSLAFIVNGKSDGNAFGDAGTQIGLGLLGPLLHPAPRTGLVIGLGTGESAGWMSAVEEMTSVDVVELEPVVLEMTQRCSQINANALKNTKLTLHFNDAREFLLTSKKQYDLIVSEPSNPYRAGIANLYTREFYDSVSTRLTSDGLFLQWLQGYEVDDSTVHIVLQTVRSVFPEVQIWRTKARDMVLVCGKSEQAFQYQLDSLQQKLKQPVIAEGLKQGWSAIDVEGVLAHFVCGNRTINQLLESHSEPMNLDDRNLLEYAFAKTVGKSTRFSIHDLQDRAVRLNDDLPVTIGTEGQEKVIQRRLAMQLSLGGTVYIADSLSEVQQTRGEAYNLYLARHYLDALTRFQKFEPDLSCPIETLVYAHTLAESGVPVPDELLMKVRKQNPTEAAAIETIAALQQKQNDAGLQKIIETLKLLQDSPWGSRQLLDAVLFKAVSLCDLNSNYAAPLYEQLQQPFALYRLEDNRLLVRYLISEKMDNQQIIDSLQTMEPNVPWKEWLLEKRARVYSAGKHPLTEQARSELSQFKRANH